MLWNIDLTLVDVGRVTRAAYAAAFRAVTGRPLVRLPQLPGRSESEIFFEALALNGVDIRDGEPAERLLGRLQAALVDAFADRRDLMRDQGRALPGAAQAVAAVARLDGVAQTVLTGASKPNALLKLGCFGLDELLDVEIGGYGDDPYPKGALLRVARERAAEKYGVPFERIGCVYVADSVRDVTAAGIGGARSIAVASGRATAAELAAAGADVVLTDLTDQAAVVAAVETLTSADGAARRGRVAPARRRSDAGWYANR